MMYLEKDVKKLKREFEKNKKNYTKNEIGSGTQSFVKQFFEKYLQLNEETNYNDSKNKFFLQEGKKSMGDNSRADFILKINGIKVVVEVEKRNHINLGIKQIKEYLKAENTDYGILTDSEKWYFYTKGFDESKGTFGGGIEKDIDFLLTEEGFNFIENLFKTKEFYEKEILKKEKILVGYSENIKDEDKKITLKEFHKELISLAEKLKYDFSEQGIFNISNQNKDKNFIQAIYAFIIQFILIKIIQDKKGIKKIDKEEILNFLKKDNYTDLVNYTFESINWLDNFYEPYQDEQKSLIDSIKSKYKDGKLRNAKINFEGSRIFLDLYNFIFKFNFKSVEQDIFGAVYENYLKELYKDDDSKKGQVFTPPEIVNFMLEEINYTPEYIKSKIEEYIEKNGIDKLKEDLKENKDKVEFNIDGLSIIDPACGSGTFLYKATWNILQAIHKISGIEEEEKGVLVENLIINNVVGFDIEAFPLYLAEMNILQILLFFNVNNKGEIINKINKGIKLFSTKDTISEFASMENNIKDILIELDNGNNDFSIFIKRNGKEISKIKLEILNKNFKGIKKVVEKYLINQIRDKLNKYKELLDTKRKKFDFVIGNPPYVAYNQMNKDIKNNWKNIGLEMSDVFGINLHSIPGNNKKYPPKPNLYSYFGALAYYLAKEGGKVSYIVPEGFTAYDCNSYYLLNKVNLQKLYFFNTKVFTDRGINGKMDVATSAIIFKYTKEQKQDNLCITSYKSKGEKEELKKVLYFMKVEGNKKYISKDLAKEYISNGLSILKQNKQILEFLKFYKQNTDSLAIYYEHSNPNKPVKDNFYFDIGYILEDKYIINDNNDGYLLFIKGSDLNKFYIEDTGKYYPSYEDYIKLTKNSQGYSLLNNKYYLAISIKNGDIFTFFDKKIIFNMGSASCIGSNNKLEMLYLFSILNSYIAKFIKKIFTIEGEKDFLFSLTFLKGQIRVPKIDSQIKKELKEKLIKNGEKIINYVKNKSSVKKKYKDIFETEPDLISLGEKITGIKEEYKNLEEKIKEIEGVKELSKLNNKLEDNLPEEILKLLPNELEKFEEERDLIVYCLYFGSENGNDEYINLSEIDVNNILKYKEKISNNKWVKVIYGEGKSENDIKKMK